jgi:hypothetical protein
MLRRVALVRTDVSKELSASFIRITRIDEPVLGFLRSVRRLLVTASVVPSSPILVTLIKEGQSSSETSVLTRATRRNIPEDTVFLSCLHKVSRALIHRVRKRYISNAVLGSMQQTISMTTLLTYKSDSNSGEIPV